MKQHITIDQIEELSKESRLKLWKWFDKNGYETVYPSIGQMIELLGDHDALAGDEWDSLVFPTVGTYEFKKKPNELCDELWEAVKEVLNE